jgi:two-component system chemotaxis response regulator CheY
MKILIVDDDNVCRALMQELLRPYGLASVAANGQQAVDAVRQAIALGEHYNLICLDIMMPKLNGQAALRQIRELEQANGIFPAKGAKIIMTTAMNTTLEIDEAFDGRCDAYLVKPVTKKELNEALRQLALIK